MFFSWYEIIYIHKCLFDDDGVASVIISAHIDPIDDLYYFETDHIALRENSDYKNLSRAVVLLEAQRTRAIEDLDKLIEIQQQAIQAPIKFVDKLQHKVTKWTTDYLLHNRQ